MMFGRNSWQAQWLNSVRKLQGETHTALDEPKINGWYSTEDILRDDFGLQGEKLKAFILGDEAEFFK